MGQVANLRVDCQSAQPGKARPWSFYIFVRGPVAPAVLPPVFLCRQISFRNTGGKTAGATEKHRKDVSFLSRSRPGRSGP